jgi:hypothetical protein
MSAAPIKPSIGKAGKQWPKHAGWSKHQPPGPTNIASIVNSDFYGAKPAYERFHSKEDGMNEFSHQPIVDSMFATLRQPPGMYRAGTIVWLLGQGVQLGPKKRAEPPPVTTALFGMNGSGMAVKLHVPTVHVEKVVGDKAEQEMFKGENITIGMACATEVIVKDTKRMMPIALVVSEVMVLAMPSPFGAHLAELKGTFGLTPEWCKALAVQQTCVPVGSKIFAVALIVSDVIVTYDLAGNMTAQHITSKKITTAVFVGYDAAEEGYLKFKHDEEEAYATALGATQTDITRVTVGPLTFLGCNQQAYSPGHLQMHMLYKPCVIDHK